MSPEELRPLIDQSLIQLAGHVPFQAYMQLQRDSREAIIADLCTDAVIQNDRLTLAALGELRTLTQQLDAYEQVKAKVASEVTS